MSQIFEIATYGIYFIGIVIVLFSVILSREDSKKEFEETVQVYVQKKHCVWNNKVNDINYVVDIIYNNETFKIKDKVLFDSVKENSFIKMKLVKEINEFGESEVNLIYS